jgi:two-component system, sensor histidine kinase LadS
MGWRHVADGGGVWRNRRAADLAARIGGEEFAVLLPNIDIEGAMSVAETIRARIEALCLPHTKSPMGVVTASVGVAVATADGTETVQALMATADKALYKAKTSGRNRAEVGKC